MGPERRTSEMKHHLGYWRILFCSICTEPVTPDQMKVDCGHVLCPECANDLLTNQEHSEHHTRQ
ncbi:MAG: hypothetical protein ACWGQW_16740 [bacterium]